MEKVGRNRRRSNRLTSNSIREIIAAGRKGRHSDGGNLYLAVSPNGSARWVFLYRWRDAPEQPGPGAPREMGLGSYDTVTLNEARREAAALRKGLREGISPLPPRAPRKPPSSVGAQTDQNAPPEPSPPPIALARSKKARRPRPQPAEDSGQLTLFG